MNALCRLIADYGLILLITIFKANDVISSGRGKIFLGEALSSLAPGWLRPDIHVYN